MKVSFDRTFEDMVYFNDYHFRHSPSMRRTQRRWSLAGTLIVGAVVALMNVSYGVSTMLLWGVIAATAYLVFTVWVTRWSRRSQVRKLLAEGHGKSAIGPHEIEIGPDGIREKSPGGESHYRWSAVERVSEDVRYIFIYVAPTAAHIIPKSAFATADDAAGFLRQAQSLADAATGNSASS